MKDYHLNDIGEDMLEYSYEINNIIDEVVEEHLLMSLFLLEVFSL